MKKDKLADEVIESEKTEKPEAKLSTFLEAYKKQNPVKYEAKKARGEFKGL